MPRSADWMNRSCAIVRPDTRIVVWSRWSRVNVRGTSSNQCLAPSIGRPSRLRSSISNCFSSASIASMLSASRLLPLLSLVVLMGSPGDWLVLHYVEGRRPLGLGPVGFVGGPPCGHALVERADLAVEPVVGPADPCELALQELHHLELLLADRALELLLLDRVVL